MPAVIFPSSRFRKEPRSHLCRGRRITADGKWRVFSAYSMIINSFVPEETRQATKPAIYITSHASNTLCLRWVLARVSRSACSKRLDEQCRQVSYLSRGQLHLPPPHQSRRAHHIYLQRVRVHRTGARAYCVAAGPVPAQRSMSVKPTALCE